MKKLVRIFLLTCILIIFTGCTNDTENNLPQIALMELSNAQQEIVDLLSHLGQEFLVFEYTGGIFTQIEIWVEVYHYGDLMGRYADFVVSSETSTEVEPIVIAIHQPSQHEFQWILSTGGGRSTSEPWTTQGEYLLRAFGLIREPVKIVYCQEIILYLSKFTTDITLNIRNDLQYYLEYPENLAGNTYVHIIKIRFTK